jgi:hypothetical protein
MSLKHISSLLHMIRVTSLVTAVLIVIGSLCLHSSNSLPLTISSDSYISEENNKTWIIQSITDRRLISTLVAAQASIFCPLFILLNPSSSKASCFIGWICQLLMPLGLALSWMFSILFDCKTTALVNEGSLCLNGEDGCILFGVIHGLKHAIILLFAVETFFVTSHFIIARYHTPQIQLPLEDEEAVVLVVEEVAVQEKN